MLEKNGQKLFEKERGGENLNLYEPNLSGNLTEHEDEAQLADAVTAFIFIFRILC